MLRLRIVGRGVGDGVTFYPRGPLQAPSSSCFNPLLRGGHLIYEKYRGIHENIAKTIGFYNKLLLMLHCTYYIELIRGNMYAYFNKF